jgi:uncharacterized protein YerC
MRGVTTMCDKKTCSIQRALVVLMALRNGRTYTQLHYTSMFSVTPQRKVEVQMPLGNDKQQERNTVQMPQSAQQQTLRNQAPLHHANQ